jgi:hypothetical protein
MKESEALPESLSFVFALHSQAQPHMEAPQPAFQSKQGLLGAKKLAVFHSQFSRIVKLCKLD